MVYYFIASNAVHTMKITVF